MPVALVLTRSERLLLARKRRQETQTQAAARYNVSPKLYGLWERGQVGLPFTMTAHIKMQPHERCLILRRRSGLTQEEIARRLRCSRWWLNRMEQGKAPAQTLLDYWGD